MNGSMDNNERFCMDRDLDFLKETGVIEPDSVYNCDCHSL